MGQAPDFGRFRIGGGEMTKSRICLNKFIILKGIYLGYSELFSIHL